MIRFDVESVLINNLHAYVLIFYFFRMEFTRAMEKSSLMLSLVLSVNQNK